MSEPSVSPSSSENRLSKRLKPIPLFLEGGSDTPFSAGRMNQIVRALNALLGVTIVDGSTNDVTVSDTNMVIQVKRPPSNSAGGSGNMNYRGAWSGDVDYAVKDVVYTDPDPSTRYLFIAETANGPSTTIEEPDVDLQLRWRCIGMVNTSTPVVAQCYRIKSVQSDYLTCRTWDGTTEGGSDVYVARSFRCRNPASDDDADYTYGSPTERVATSGTMSENQKITPPYAVNDLVFAIRSDFTGVTVSGTALTLIEINDGRAWAAPENG